MLNKLQFSFPKYRVLIVGDYYHWLLAPMRMDIIGTMPRTGLLGKVFKRKTVTANLSSTVGNANGYVMLGQEKYGTEGLVGPAIMTIVHDKA